MDFLCGTFIFVSLFTCLLDLYVKSFSFSLFYSKLTRVSGLPYVFHSLNQCIYTSSLLPSPLSSLLSFVLSFVFPSPSPLSYFPSPSSFFFLLRTFFSVILPTTSMFNEQSNNFCQLVGNPEPSPEMSTLLWASYQVL